MQRKTAHNEAWWPKCAAGFRRANGRNSYWTAVVGVASSCRLLVAQLCGRIVVFVLHIETVLFDLIYDF